MKRNYFRQRHPSKSLTVTTKGYDITDDTISIDNGGTFNVVPRGGGKPVTSYDLATSPVDIWKSGDCFNFVGSNEPTDGYVNQTGLQNNSVTLTTEFELDNIGGGDSINLNVYIGTIVLDKTTAMLKFYKRSI